jgi:hypothetical protein
MAPRTRLPHEAYVWQRAWDSNVCAAVRTAAPTLAGFAVLAAELSWSGGKVRTARVTPDYATLAASGKPVAVAVRVGACPDRFLPDSPPVRAAAALAADALAAAGKAGLRPCEVQLDYDCPESRLADYTNLVAGVRRRVGTVPLTLTALPCWLEHREFADLARLVDGFVLQVHSLDPPVNPADGFVLCRPARAMAWARRASRIGVPFRIALPTYAYAAAFAPDGRLLGVSAEGPSPDWGRAARLTTLRSDPVALARLVHDLERARLDNLRGFLWYRLPVQGDRLNWKWRTLSAIAEGRVPKPRLHVQVVHDDSRLAEVFLVNDGEADAAPPQRVRVTWGNGDLAAGDGLNGFSLVRHGSRAARLERTEDIGRNNVSAGFRLKIAWLRFAGESGAVEAR